MNWTLRGTTALAVVVAVLTAASGVAMAAPHTLTNAPGDGTVTVGVDGFGAFGSSVGTDSTDALYDPVGAIGVGGTTFESGVAIRFSATAGGRTFLTSGFIAGSGGLLNPPVAGTSTTATSAFTFGALSFSLTQTLTPLISGGSQVGSDLTQVYSMTNTSSSPLFFELIRYLDGDLFFDGSLIDGGGRLFAGATEILFETDSATGAADPTTFVGITGEGGTSPGSGRFEIDSFSGLRGRIIAGTALDDTITGDGADADSFIDAGAGYDVTLALRNIFELGAGSTDVYTTRTIFGSGEPAAVPPPTGVPIPPTALLLTVGVAALAVRSWRIRRAR